MEYVSAPWEIGFKTHVCVGPYNLGRIFDRDGSGTDGVNGSETGGTH
jgi:hypothetical protein